MPSPISEFAYNLILELIVSGIEKIVDLSVIDFFQQRKINKHIEDTVANIVEPLLVFLTQESIPEDKQRRLFQTCVSELRPLVEEPEKLFQNSLNGNKIFENLYKNRKFPEVVLEDDVKDTYILLCPRIAEMLCKVPSAIKEWKTLAWTENYRRLDELSMELQQLFSKVDEMQHGSKTKAEEVLNRVRRSLAQKIGLEMDITGLRGDQPQVGKFTDFFIHPIIHEIIEPHNENKALSLENTTEAYSFFSKPHHVSCIIGGAGAGKSTWSKWLQREILNPNNRGIGVRVELRSLQIENLKSIYDLVRETAGINYEEELTADVISYWLDKALIIFIFDGFDEIMTDNRDVLYNWLCDFSQDTRGCPIILTSRPLTSDHLGRKTLFTGSWSIEPFDLPRIVEYIQKWYTNSPQINDSARLVNSTELAMKWQNDPTLEPLTGNPLLLSTLLLVHYLDGELPNGRSQLYKRYIEGMLGVWDDCRKLITTTISLTRIQKNLIIRNLALFMFLQNKDQLDESIILDWLQKFLITNSINFPALDVLCILRERTGLLIGPGLYSFAHKSIAEFLVADVVLQGDQIDNDGNRIDRLYLFEKRDNDQWNSVIFFWSGLAPVIDLIKFIEVCLDVENLPLAYGVLYDQFDRISDKETRRRLITIKTQSENENWLDNYTHSRAIYGVYGSPENKRIIFTIPLIDLRGINQRGDYRALLVYAIRNNMMNIQDRLINNSKFLQKNLWLIYTRDFLDKNTITELMQKPFFCDSDIDWHIYLMNQILRKTIISNGDLVEVINLCHQFFPNYIGIIPFFLISDSSALIFYTNAIEFPDIVRKIATALTDSCGGLIDISWLIGSNKWRLESSPKNIFDLLIWYKNFLHFFVKNRLLPYDEVIERCEKYIDELVSIRLTNAKKQKIKLVKYSSESKPADLSEILLSPEFPVSDRRSIFD